jgi:hypothetical protein
MVFEQFTRLIGRDDGIRICQPSVQHRDREPPLRRLAPTSMPDVYSVPRTSKGSQVGGGSQHSVTSPK